MTHETKPLFAESKPLPDAVTRWGAVLLLVGVAAAIVAYAVEPTRASFSNVILYLFGVSVALGALFLIALEYIAGAVWSVPMRRVNEFMAGVIPFLPVLVLPLLFHLHDLFHWTHAEAVQHDELLQAKAPYLNVSFFLLRTAGILAVWILFYWLFIRNSVKQDVLREQYLTRRNIRLAAVFLPIFAITISLTAIDWAMSLEAHWYSTIFGVYYFSGTVLCALAVTTYVVVRFQEGGLLPMVNRDHLYSLGALMFGFVNFWAYIAFSQFLLIWYANIPEETTWFMTRWQNGWEYVSIVLILVHFLVPYFVLLPQESKMDSRRLKFIALWILVAHFVDLYWLVMPTQYPTFRIGWVEIVFPVILIGLALLLLAWKVQRYNIIPLGDPKLQRGLDFRL